MAATLLQRLVWQLRRSAEPRPGEVFSDAELLQRFQVDGDPEVLAAILCRHGLSGLSVCRKVLRCEADIEDVFQATFFVPVCNARSIRQGDRLGGWLRGVAHRRKTTMAPLQSSPARI